MPVSSPDRKRWIAAALPVLVFAASFFAFDRLLMFGLKASATRYYASLDAGDFRSDKSIVFGQGDGDVLVFGSSRAGQAFGENQLSAQLNKRILKDANAGRYPRFFYYYYLKYRNSRSRPAAVFYGTDYFMFEKQSSQKDLALLDKTIKLDVLNPAGSVNEASPFLSRISRLFRKKPEIDDFLGDRLKLDRDGEDEELAAGKKKAPAPAKKVRKKRGRIKSVHPRTYQPYPGIEGAFLTKLLDVLEEDGVPVFIVIIPDYAGTNEINFEQNKFKSDLEGLARPYKKVSLLDFNLPDRFDLNDPSLFREGAESRTNCHLSFEGRKRFTLKLIDAVRPILALESAPDGTGSGKKP